MLVDSNVPTRLHGDKVIDDRGSVTFINQFDFKNIKRFYTVRNHRAGFVRAWHGHKHEGKHVLVVQGTILVKLLDINSYINWMALGSCQLPSGSPQYVIQKSINSVILSEQHPGILWIPPGFYNGFKTLTENAIIQFFSTSTLEESHGDDIRLAWDVFGKEIWEEEYR